MLVFVLAMLIGNTHPETRDELVGAWRTEKDGYQNVLVVTEKCFSITTFNVVEKKFGSTRGGSWMIEGNKLILKDEFNTANQAEIGQSHSFKFSMAKNTLTFSERDLPLQWERIDDGSPGKLAGAWLITGRMVNNEMQSITPGARRTMKILSGSRFQWIAYNEETKEFLGTGGGTYTTENGKYTEHIEFFSRDASRVGMDLSFDFSIDDAGGWRHKGFSSKGDPIDEVWTKRERIRL